MEKDGEERTNEDGVDAGFERGVEVGLGDALEVEKAAVQPKRGDEEGKHAGKGAETVAEEGEGRGPDEVELFFDAERPGVTEEAAGVAVQSLVVVADVEQGADGLGPDDVGMPRQQESDGDDPVGVERRKDTQRAADVEVAEGDVPRSVVLAEKEMGDEESADDEEGEDTEARGNGHVAAVIDHHDASADSAQEVEPGDARAGAQMTGGIRGARRRGRHGGGCCLHKRFVSRWSASVKIVA